MTLTSAAGHLLPQSQGGILVTSPELISCNWRHSEFLSFSTTLSLHI